LKEILNDFRDMSTEDIELAYQAFCGCATPPSQTGDGGGGSTVVIPDNPAARHDCARKFVETMCRDEIMTGLVVANNAMQAALLLGWAKIPMGARNTLLAFAVVMEAWEGACSAQTITDSALAALCKLHREVLSLSDYIPDIAAGVLAPLLSWLGADTISNFIRECCSDAKIAATPLPAYYMDPEGWRNDPSNAALVPAYFQYIPPMATPVATT
jgi:hypothetical protein